MNNVFIIGRLCRDPEMRYSQNGIAYCNFTMAVPRNRDREKADFIDCTAFGKLSETIANYMRKGSQMAVTGELQVSEYADKNGERRYRTQVIAGQAEFLARPKDQQEEPNASYQQGNESANWDSMGKYPF